jgi:hypothetical protein
MSETSQAAQQQVEVKNVVIPVATLQSLINYLVEKPFKETAGLLQLLQTTAKPVDLQEAEQAPAA